MSRPFAGIAGVWSLAGARNSFLLHTVQICIGAYSAPYSVGAGISFPLIKRGGRKRTYLHPVQKLRMSGAIPPLLYMLSWGEQDVLPVNSWNAVIYSFLQSAFTVTGLVEHFVEEGERPTLSMGIRPCSSALDLCSNRTLMVAMSLYGACQNCRCQREANKETSPIVYETSVRAETYF